MNESTAIATIVDALGSHTIAAPVSLASNTTVSMSQCRRFFDHIRQYQWHACSNQDR